MITPSTIALALMLAAEPSGAGAPAPEALVLGLRAPDRTVETVWVDGAGATLLGRGLAVPRKSGWWKVDVLKASSRPGDDIGGFHESFALVAAPAGRKLRLPAWARARPAADSEEPQCGGGNQITIHFAGPEWVSFEDARISECEGDMRPDITVGSVTWPLDLLALPPERQDPADAFEKAIAPDVPKAVEAKLPNVPASPDSGCPPDSAKAAAIVRHRGRWAFQAEGRSSANVCRGQITPFILDVPVPARFVGPDTLPQSFERYAAEHPGLSDALASPSGALVVLVTAAGIEVRSPGRVAVALALPGRTVVMAQWAVGPRNVERWRKDAAAALR